MQCINLSFLIVSNAYIVYGIHIYTCCQPLKIIIIIINYELTRKAGGRKSSSYQLHVVYRWSRCDSSRAVWGAIVYVPSSGNPQTW